MLMPEIVLLLQNTSEIKSDVRISKTFYFCLLQRISYNLGQFM